MPLNLIRDKIVLRTSLALIAPISIYSVGHLSATLMGITTLPYFSQVLWLLIGGVSAIYPLNRISLAMLFEPITYLCDRQMKKDFRTPEKNPILQGNFASVHKENQYSVLDIIEGKVPTDLNGVYLRNGPNFKYIPSSNRVHWFDGDSMIHAFRMKDGKIFYCNRYTMTPRLQ
jgi:hypothetical protein